MVIRTKIVATVGPASGSKELLRSLAEAGCDVFRINFSHGNDEQRGRFYDAIRAVEAELGEPLAIMADLCGPKVRVGPVEGDHVVLEQGAEIVIERDGGIGTAERISTTLPELVDEVGPGQAILLSDGAIKLVVDHIDPPNAVTCRVVRGGALKTGKGVNLPDTELTLSALTEKDRRDVQWIGERDFDYVALSFVRSPRDVVELRELLADAGSDAHIVAKIEKPQALEHVEEIIDQADAVMVARGDLGVEMDLPAVPVAQKRIARLCQAAGKPCIIATQMLESMIESATPTRAEVSDVANAVLDQADAVMLSAETASGRNPVEAVAVMNDIVQSIESFYDETATPQRVSCLPQQTVSALAWAAREIALGQKIAAIGVFTATGTTARLLAKSRMPCPILAMSPDVRAMRRAGLYYGVEPVHADAPEHTRQILALAARFCVDKGIAEPGDRIVVLSGRPIGAPGATNTLVVHQIPA